MPINFPEITTPPASPKNKLETAIGYYLASYAATAGGVLAPLWFYPSQAVGEKVLPCCITFCEEAREIKAGSRAYQAGLFIYLETQKDDETLTDHDERLILLGNAMQNTAAVMSAVNPGNAARVVPNFTLFGYAEDILSQNDRQRHFGDHLYYQVGFAGYDAS